MNRVTRAGQGRAFRARAVCCCSDLNGHACWSRLVFDNGFCDHDFCFCMMCFPSMLGVFGCRPVGGSAIERKSVGGGWNKSAMGRTRGEERNSKFECIDAATIHNSKWMVPYVLTGPWYNKYIKELQKLKLCLGNCSVFIRKLLKSVFFYPWSYIARFFPKVQVHGCWRPPNMFPECT